MHKNLLENPSIHYCNILKVTTYSRLEISRYYHTFYNSFFLMFSFFLFQIIFFFSLAVTSVLTVHSLEKDISSVWSNKEKNMQLNFVLKIFLIILSFNCLSVSSLVKNGKNKEIPKWKKQVSRKTYWSVSYFIWSFVWKEKHQLYR